jgi:hypothetical protein
MAGIEARRVEYTGRRAVLLANDQVRTLVEAGGGMVPEFGVRRGAAVVNAHWIPDFRDVSGTPYSPAVHEPYWKAKLLHMMAGDYTCSPSFGGACEVDGASLPIHGWTANEDWTVEVVGVDEEARAAWTRSSLRSPSPRLPLTWVKHDFLFAGEAAYYSAVRIENSGAAPVTVNLVRHNTVGPPFLAPGCRLSLAAERFMAAPAGTEFDLSGRLTQGAEFGSLAAAPLRAGGTADLREVPGPIGHTDMVMGAIPERLALGWSCLVNPALKLGYVCFFPGMAGLPAGEIALGFNELWLQYGGRPFTPWALEDGGADRILCLGTENGTSSWGNGLGYARANPRLLGRDTLVEIPARGARTLIYGTAMLALDDALVGEGVAGIEAAPGTMVLKGARSVQKISLGADFAAARALLARLARAG